MESNIYWICYRFWHIIFMILILQILATIYVDQFSFLCLIWLSSLNCVFYIWIYAHSDPIKLTHGFEVIIEIITVSLFLFFFPSHKKTQNWFLPPCFRSGLFVQISPFLCMLISCFWHFRYCFGKLPFCMSYNPLSLQSISCS